MGEETHKNGAPRPPSKEWEDGVSGWVRLLDGYVMSPPSGSMHRGESMMMTADIVGPGEHTLDRKATDSNFVFDSWDVGQVGRLASGILGLHWYEDPSIQGNFFEDLSPLPQQTLNVGTPGNPFWEAKDGVSWLAFLKTVFTYSGMAHLGVTINPADGRPVLTKCCPYCRNVRSGDPDSIYYLPLHMSGGPASVGCQLVDMERTGLPHPNSVDFFICASGKDATDHDLPHGQLIQKHPDSDNSEVVMAHTIHAPEFSIEDEYYNQVTITGVKYGRKDTSLSATMTDWYSVHGEPSPFGYSLGHVKSHNEGPYPWANQQAIVNSLAWATFWKVTREPLYLEVSCPFLPNAYNRKVFAVLGGKRLGVDGKRFRIVSCTHSGVRKNNFADATTLRGVYIGTLDDSSIEMPED